MQDKIVDTVDASRRAHLGLGFVYLYGELRVCGCALDLHQLCEVAK